jgi:chemotaxis protein CheX
MDPDIVSSMIEATINVIKTMARLEPKAGTPVLKTSKHTWGVVTGVIGMAGDKVSGSLCVSFDESSILEIVSNMFGEPFATLNEEVVDAVGELTNMIAGGTKKILAENGCQFEMATPMMLKGKDVELKFFTNSPVIQVPFTIGNGHFVVEANLALRTQKDRLS